MAINEGPSMDMSTIDESPSATKFVLEPGAQQIGGMYDPQRIVFAPGDAPHDEDVDVSYVDDQNDISWKDVTDVVEGIGSGAKDLANKALEYIGVGEKPKQQKKTEEAVPQTSKQKPKPVQTGVAKAEPGGAKNIISLQSYFKNPDPALKSLLGGRSYTGPVDGNVNPELKSLASSLESSISEIIGTKDVFGVVLNTNAKDVREAVEKTVQYNMLQEDNKNRNKVAKMRLDDRFYMLSTIYKQKK